MLEILNDRLNSHNLVTGSITIALLGATLISFLFAPSALAGGGLRFKWENLSLDKPDAETKPHWLLCEQLRRSLTASGTPPRLRFFCGTSSEFIFGRKETTVTLTSMKLTRADGDWYPNFCAFLVREYKGYMQIVDVRDDNGLPRQVQLQTQVEWKVPRSLSGEKLKIFVFIAADAADFESIKLLSIDQLLKVDVK